jgi:sterol 22-desaturase
VQGFSDADVFDPDRFSPERQEDLKFQRYFLTFGCGPHSCVGREYAINHLTVFLAILSTR